MIEKSALRGQIEDRRSAEDTGRYVGPRMTIHGHVDSPQEIEVVCLNQLLRRTVFSVFY